MRSTIPAAQDQLLRAITRMISVGPDDAVVPPRVFELRPIGKVIKTEKTVSCQWVECAGSILAAFERVPLKGKVGYCLVTVGEVVQLGLSIAQEGGDLCHYGINGMQDLSADDRLLVETALAGFAMTGGGIVFCP